MRLNRKGITTIEILICFVIVVIITISMYSVVSAYNEKRLLENYKEQITSYKNILTKEIQDDLIKVGLTAARYSREVVNATGTSIPVKNVYTVDMDLRDGTKRRLVVEQTLTKSSYHPSGYANGSTSVNDEFMILYGAHNSDSDKLVEYALPDLGSYQVEETGAIAQDLSINNVLINIYDEKVLSIYIGFYHPELGTRYAIDLIGLIDFSFTGAEFMNPDSVYYSITYELNGGRYPAGITNPFIYSSNSGVIINNPVRDGYHFTGWTGSNGPDPQKDLYLSIGSTGDKSFSANWAANHAYFLYHVLPDETLEYSTVHTNGDGTHSYWVLNENGYIVRIQDGYDPLLVNNKKDIVANNMNLNDYNNPGFIYISKPGYKAVDGAEWLCESGCKDSGMTFPHSKFNFDANNYCNANAGDCQFVIRVNWTKETYTITYDLVDGVVNGTNPDSFQIDSGMITIINPSKEGYTFDGWTGTDLTDPTKFLQIPTGSYGDRSYTANWTPIEYTITYDLDGGVLAVENPSTYNITTLNFSLNVPTKMEKTFKGWTGSNGTTPEKNVTIARGSTGNRHYVANWE